MQIFDRAARARLVAQQRRKLCALLRIEDGALGDQLLDDQALLGLLQRLIIEQLIVERAILDAPQRAQLARLLRGQSGTRSTVEDLHGR